MGLGESWILSIAILFGSIYFICGNYNSKDEFKSALAWILGAILFVITFFQL